MGHHLVQYSHFKGNMSINQWIWGYTINNAQFSEGRTPTHKPSQDDNYKPNEIIIMNNNTILNNNV